MMHKKVAVSANPPQVGNFVVFTILVQMMHYQHTPFFCSAKRAFRRDSSTHNRCFVRVFSVPPVWMFFPDKRLTVPLKATGPATKKFFRLRPLKGLSLFIYFFPTNKTGHNSSSSSCLSKTMHRAVLAFTLLLPRRF